MIEYFRVKDSNRRNGGIGSQGWGGQHLANALKYSTAFPVIILATIQRNQSPNPDERGITEASLFRLWVFAAMVNSFYSFYWDVAKDWDLTLFSPVHERNCPSHPFGLRSRLYFPHPNIYYIVIATDLLLRCTWALKLSSRLDHFADFESGIFLLGFLEVIRRWIWIFFRVETEWVRATSAGGLGSPGQNDVLLGDYGSGKEDDD